MTISQLNRITQEGLLVSPFDIDVVEFSKSEVESAIPTRFKKIVEIFQDNVAIKFRDKLITYSQFNQLTNQLARVLRDDHRVADEPVAYLLGYGVKSIIAIFGILKAGGYYVPIDPNFPVARQKYMIEDLNARIIITDNENLSLASELNTNNASIINLDVIDKDVSMDEVEIDISPNHYACIHYTSGSTGEPKGVIQNHRNLLHATWVAGNLNRYTSNDRVALLHSTGFAASIMPILVTLMNGASLYPFDLKNDLGNLANWLKDERITVYKSVATLFRNLAYCITENDTFPDLRLMSAGGETVHKSDVELFRKHFGRYSIMTHGIGGTEMQMFRTFFIDKNTEIIGNSVPVGYAVEDKEVLILDDQGKKLGCNEEGEIVLHSRYLSPGYWKSPELTQKKFKDDPHNPGVRYYWTGDLGRIDEHGCLFHLGRKDFQVKIRGLRIELGEIESVLMEHEDIKEAVVKVYDRPGYEKRLVAYLVPDNQRPKPTSEELRIYLKKKVPDYMVPSFYVMLDAMPLTATGKINRRLLPSLEEIYNLKEDYVAPRTITEKRLVRIWERVLDLSPIGIRHEFLQLGGHSLLAANLVTEIEAEFGKRLDLASLSEATTIEKMAHLLDEKEFYKSGLILVPIETKGSKPPLYCVHGAGGHVMPFMRLANLLRPHQPVYGLQSKSIEQRQDQVYSLEMMAADYVDAIREHQEDGPYHLAGFSFGGFVAYEMARQLAKDGQKVGLLAILDSLAPSASGYFDALSGWKKLCYKFRSFKYRVKYHWQNISKLPLNEIYDYFRTKMSRPDLQEVIMGDVEDEEVPDYMLDIINSNIAALRKYTPGEYDGQLVLFKSMNHGRGVYYGWQELVNGEVEEYFIPGNHRGVLQDPNVEILAHKLSQLISSQ